MADQAASPVGFYPVLFHRGRSKLCLLVCVLCSWTLLGFVVKLMLTQWCRAFGDVVGSAGLLRAALKQYEVGLVKEALWNSNAEYAGEVNNDPVIAVQTFEHLVSGLIGEIDLTKEGVPQADPSVKDQLIELRQDIQQLHAQRIEFSKGVGLTAPFVKGAVEKLNEAFLLADGVVKTLSAFSRFYADLLYWIVLCTGILGTLTTAYLSRTALRHHKNAMQWQQKTIMQEQDVILNAQDLMIASLEHQLHQAERAANQGYRDVLAHHAQINSKKDQIHNQQSLVEDLQEQLAARQTDVSIAEATLEEQRGELERLHGSVAAQEKLISSLQDEAANIMFPLPSQAQGATAQGTSGVKGRSNLVFLEGTRREVTGKDRSRIGYVPNLGNSARTNSDLERDTLKLDGHWIVDDRSLNCTCRMREFLIIGNKVLDGLGNRGKLGVDSSGRVYLFGRALSQPQGHATLHSVGPRGQCQRYTRHNFASVRTIDAVRAARNFALNADENISAGDDECKETRGLEV